jgi:hypothetical protein
LTEQEFPPNLIKAQGNTRNFWDAIIIVLSIYQAIVIPFNISFQPDFLNAPFVRTMDSLIDMIFALDIILRFRTTYIDPVSGEEVVDSYLIGIRYLTSS